MLEKHRAQHGNATQQRDVELRQGGTTIAATCFHRQNDTGAQVPGDTDRQNIDDGATNNLVGFVVERQYRMYHHNRTTGQNRRNQPQPRIAKC